MQMPETVTFCVLQKKGFLLNFTKFRGNSCARGSTCEFYKFLRTCFLQNNSRRLLPKVDISMMKREI